MLDADGTVLYVGKAKNLKRRVSSYFGRALTGRIQRMVSLIASIDVTVTRTEADALLLEGNLIKALQPRFNVLLRDDKSYPDILLTTRDEFPRLAFHRGSRKGQGRFFGPYPSASAVRETLQLLQKLFPVRQCEDSFFRNRSRPCLQYQIKRCHAPCVGLISADDYAQDVAATIKFLEGRAQEVVDDLGAAMEQAAGALDFERAAILRDRILTLRQIQSHQSINGEVGDLDIIACAQEGGLYGVQVFFIRGGRNLGNRGFFPVAPEETSLETLMAGFLAQCYTDKNAPPALIVNIEPDDRELLEQVFSERAGYRVHIKSSVRHDRARWLEMACDNARIAIRARLSSQAGYARRLEALRMALELDRVPTRMECFDISHTQGECPVASCVVFDHDGSRQSEYRRFNIVGLTPGDDYAAIAQALTRRYVRVQQGDYPLPDLLLIDGGRGQLSAADRALQAIGVTGARLVGVAKGAARRPGTEQLWLLGREAPIILPGDSPALHLIVQIRDEAHRFAITAHRQRRAKARITSTLENIRGVGATRRQRLLKQFGGLRGLARAGVDEIAGIDGISRQLAQQIYDAFHHDVSGS